MGTSDAEQALQKVRKLSANKECVNCGETSRLGFGAVCVKFRTFVCNNCKTSHQAFSHRVKSVTMSEWTMDEVEALKKKNGGGNEVARAKWYAHWTSTDEQRYKPKPGDKIDKWKQLVQMVYEERRWYNENATVSSSSSSSKDAASTPTKSGARQKKSSKKQSEPKQMESMFDSLTIGGSSSNSGSSKSKAKQQEDEVDLFGAGSSNGNDEDLFGGFSDPTPVMQTGAPAPSGGMNIAQMMMPSSSGGGMDDPFAELQRPKVMQMTPQQQQQQMMRMMQQQQMQMQQQQQQQQQQQMHMQMMNGGSDDPFASLHMQRPVMMQQQRPPPQQQQQFQGMPNQMPRGQPMPPQMMYTQQQQQRPPQQQQQQPGFGVMPMMMPSSDDPFAGLQ